MCQHPLLYFFSAHKRNNTLWVQKLSIWQERNGAAPRFPATCIESFHSVVFKLTWFLEVLYLYCINIYIFYRFCQFVVFYDFSVASGFYLVHSAGGQKPLEKFLNFILFLKIRNSFILFGNMVLLLWHSMIRKVSILLLELWWMVNTLALFKWTKEVSGFWNKWSVIEWSEEGCSLEK